MNAMSMKCLNMCQRFFAMLRIVCKQAKRPTNCMHLQQSTDCTTNRATLLLLSNSSKRRLAFSLSLSLSLCPIHTSTHCGRNGCFRASSGNSAARRDDLKHARLILNSFRIILHGTFAIFPQRNVSSTSVRKCILLLSWVRKWLLLLCKNDDKRDSSSEYGTEYGAAS
jgi:hypothetical protein